MKRSMSAWWLLFLVPVCILSLPVLLVLFFAANNLAGAIWGPPAPWNRPWRSPAPAALIGRYSESERRWSEMTSRPQAALELRTDGSAYAWNLLSEVALRTCVVSGAGTWSGPDQEGQVGIDFPKAVTTGECQAGAPGYASFALAGHSQPYRLYLIIEDPDSGTGIWFDSGTNRH
jgi:hypothetical protein